MGCPFTLSDSPVEVQRSPLLGEHNEQVLQELLDYQEDELERLRRGRRLTAASSR